MFSLFIFMKLFRTLSPVILKMQKKKYYDFDASLKPKADIF